MNPPRQDIQQTAIEVIEKEQLAISSLRDSIDRSFLRAVEILHQSRAPDCYGHRKSAS